MSLQYKKKWIVEKQQLELIYVPAMAVKKTG